MKLADLIAYGELIHPETMRPTPLRPVSTAYLRIAHNPNKPGIAVTAMQCNLYGNLPQGLAD